MSNRVLLSLTAVLMLSAITVRAQDSSDPIRLAVPDMNRRGADTMIVELTLRIMGEVLKEGGYNVEYVRSDFVTVHTGLDSGKLHLTLDFRRWDEEQQTYHDPSFFNDEVMDPTGMTFQAKWWYPAYLKEWCPGLPDWKALTADECLQAFSATNPGHPGRFLVGPHFQGRYDKVAAFGLPFDVGHAETDRELLIELDGVYRRKEPILLAVHDPHWVPATYEGEWVKLPAYDDECDIDPNWGFNRNARSDCGGPFFEIWVVGWAGLKEKWPEAHRAMTALTLDNETMGRLIAEVDVDGMSVAVVAKRWMAANEAVWRDWLGE